MALDGVELEVRPGEVHALVGGNGSGKSTLIKILCGVVDPDPGGEITVDGHTVPADQWSRDLAHQTDVHAVHQDLGVFLDLTVAENLAIGSGFPRNRTGVIAWTAAHRRAQELITRFKIDAEPRTPMRALTQANRTLVAIARALQHGTHDRGLLILDEPTASLPTREADLLLDTLTRFAAAGQAILYVSHRLDEIVRIADRVTVLRDGRSVGTYAAKDLDEARLAKLIVGAELTVQTSRSHQTVPGAPVLTLEGLDTGPLAGIDLFVQPGEIVGIAGLVGSGRSTLLRTIFGVQQPRHGTLTLGGEEFRPTSSRDAIKRGVAYVPENRAEDAAFADLSISTNISVPRTKDYWSVLGMRDHASRSDANTLMKSFLVRASSADSLLSTLSGGNQQKVILARWLATKPRVLLLDEPTQGVDVGARAEIHSLVRRAADDGLSVVMVASDPEELAMACDRVVVIREGAMVNELRGHELTTALITTEIHRGQMEVA